MSQDAKRAILMTLRGIALLILLGGAFFTWYPFPLGLLIAIGIWVLTPALAVAIGADKGTAPDGSTTGQKPKSTGKFLSFILGAIVMAAILMAIGATSSMQSWNGANWGWMSSGEERTETRVVSDFNQVTFSGLGTLTIVQGDHESLTIKGSSNYLDTIKTDVSNGRLTIKPSATIWFPWMMMNQDATFTLTVKNLDDIKIAGSGKVRSDALTSDNLSISIAGSGDIRMTVTSKVTDIHISGSGNVILTGSIDEQRLAIDGSGSIDTRGATSKKASVDISGSGDTIVAATDSLSIKISGSGNVSYLGSPSLSQSISGSGKIKKID